MNKIDTRNIIEDIFNYIDCVKEETEYDTFYGHPGLYFFHSKEEFNTLLDSYLKDKEYDKYDIYYLVQRLIKFLLNKYDSHTRMWFNDSIIFPIKFKIENNKVYIVNINDEYKDIIGGEIISINNISIRDILKELEGIICYSTKEYLDDVTANYMSQINILKSLPSISNNIDKITYKVMKDNDIKEITFYENTKYEDYKNNGYENYTYEVIDNILVLHYNSCRNSEKMNVFLEDIKKISLEKNINSYIVDIRNNGGGDSSIIDPLIDYLTDKKTVTLVNEKVFSSGMMAMLDLMNIGSYIIGTKIGTALNYFGESPCKLELNDLGLSVKRSNRYWYYKTDLSCRNFTKEKFEDYFKDKKDLLEPVIINPDKYVDITVEDIINNRDPQLDSAIEYLKNN